MRKRWFGFLAICAGSLAGCSSLQESKQEYLIDYRNRRLTEEAWRSMSHQYSNMYMVDFERGWKQGYYDVASGGSGCAPAIPPSRYWHLRYQNACGHQRVMSWFNGYREGALVAEQDGVAAYSAIPTLYKPMDCKNRKPGEGCATAPDAAVPSGVARPGNVRPPSPQTPPAPPPRGEMAPVPVRPLNTTPRNGAPNAAAQPSERGLLAPPSEKRSVPALPPVLPSTSAVNSAIPPIADAGGSLTASGLTTAVPLFAKSDLKNSKN